LVSHLPPSAKLRWNRSSAYLLFLLPPPQTAPELTPWIVADPLVMSMKRRNAGEEEKSDGWTVSWALRVVLLTI
jgi:hypothetical protein